MWNGLSRFEAATCARYVLNDSVMSSPALTCWSTVETLSRAPSAAWSDPDEHASKPNTGTSEGTWNHDRLKNALISFLLGWTPPAVRPHARSSQARGTARPSQ